MISENNDVIVHAEAEVRGLFVILRNRNHPEGFRYELLLTNVTENGKSLDLTASSNPSFADAQKPSAAEEAVPGENAPKVKSSISPKAPVQVQK